MPLCGAKKRNGETCKSKGMPNGRCRMHGGKSTGAPLGSQNAKKHGIYSSVLSEDEKQLWDEIQLGDIDNELRLCRLRLKRALEAEKMDGDSPQLESYSEKDATIDSIPLKDDAKIITDKQYKRRDYSSTIDRLMGRIESLERTRIELAKSNGTPADGSGDILREDTVILKPDEPIPENPIL